jgi:hypothetical protein
MNEEGKSRSDISHVSPFGITAGHVVASNDRRKVVVRIEKEHFAASQELNEPSRQNSLLGRYRTPFDIPLSSLTT